MFAAAVQECVLKRIDHVIEKCAKKIFMRDYHSLAGRLIGNW